MTSVSSPARAPARRRRLWGWGYADETPSHEELRAAVPGVRAHLSFEPAEAELPSVAEVPSLPASRLEPPPALAAICSTAPRERALHAYPELMK